MNVCFPRKQSFISSPENKILYVFDFSNSDVLFDIIGIINFHVTKKSNLQYLLLKMFNIDTRRALEVFESKMRGLQKIRETAEGSKNNDDFVDDDHFSMKKEKKKATDFTEAFYEMIEEMPQYINYQDIESPFEGPSGHVFVGTRCHYHFVRYLLVIYQRFIKAREIIRALEEKEEKSAFVVGERYGRFKSLLLTRIKDPKIDDYIRKIFEGNAFLFLTLSKLIQKVVKTINNADDLSNNVIKSDTKDYDLEIKRLESFKPEGEIQQIMRVYR